MRILDRYILASFMVNYLLALCVLIGMYVLLDVIVNANDFARGAAPPPATTTSAIPQAAATAPVAATTTGPAAAPAPTGWEIAGDMCDYYIYQIPVIFQQVSGVIPILAAGFTMVRMTRHHELTAMLSSGVSLYRVAAPIILVSMFFAALNVLNQEYIISQPFMIDKILRKHDEMNQTATRHEPLLFIRDDYAGSHTMISAKDYDPDKRLMTDVFIVDRDPATGLPLRHTLASTAQWEIPPGETTETWVLRNVRTADDVGTNPNAGNVPILYRKTNLTPEQLDLILSKKAVDFLSSAQVNRLAQSPVEVNTPLLYKIMYLRFTQPILNIIMLLIGIPFLLTREPNRLIVNMLYCTAVSGFIFISSFVIFQMGGTQIPPLWSAWLPILIFGPFALVMMDTIHT